MHSQVIASYEGLVAHVASVWTHTRMGAHMLCPVTGARECLVTSGTFVWPLTGMGASVSFHVAILHAGKVTFTACVNVFTIVGALMSI